MIATDYEKQFGIPIQNRKPLVGFSVEDRAAEARAGAAMLRRHRYARRWDRESLSAAVAMMSFRAYSPAYLPESCFDWPIYRATKADAITPNAILSALRTAEAEYNVVFEDKAARGRFLEGMSIAQRIYRGAMNALADGRIVDD